MSPIGRVFLVLNLGLAGAFVAFSGTYLQRADHWKDRYEKRDADATREVTDLTGALRKMSDKFSEENRQNAILITNKKGFETKLAEKDRDNAALQKRLSELDATMKTATSHLSQIATELASARQDAKASMDSAIAAAAAKDEAIAKMNAADKSLDDANFKIKNLGEQVEEQTAQLASRDQKLREKEVLLQLVNERYPAIFQTLHPLVQGTVSRVGASGNTLTITVQSGGENLKAGARFAIYNAQDGYKGEATVREVDESKKLCFARVSLDQGKKIETGDNASTNLSASRGQ